jgi:hypothetical protein
MAYATADIHLHKSVSRSVCTFGYIQKLEHKGPNTKHFFQQIFNVKRMISENTICLFNLIILLQLISKTLRLQIFNGAEYFIRLRNYDIIPNW